MSAKYIFRLDDIAPNMNWESFYKLKNLFNDFNIKPLAGLIPDNQDPDLKKFSAGNIDFWKEVADLRLRGWHIAMHGYQHLYDSPESGLLGLSPRSEFAGHTFEKQLTRLQAGKKVFELHGIDVQTFIAPSHSFDTNTLKALKQLGFKNVSDGFAFYPFETHGLLFVPQLFEGPYWMPFGLITFCIHPNNLSEEHFCRIKNFLKKYHSSCICFEQAQDYISRHKSNLLFGTVANFGLRFKRLILGA